MMHGNSNIKFHKNNVIMSRKKILLTAIGLSPGGSGYIACTQIWKEKRKKSN
jgi:hypothetical protein